MPILASQALAKPVPLIPQAYASPGISLTQIITIIRARWKLSLIVFLVASVISVIAAKAIPKTYAATATLLLNYETNDPLASTIAPGAMLGNYMATQMELMQSPEVLRPVVEQLGLNNKPEYMAGYRGEGTALEWVEFQIRKNLDVEQGNQGSQLVHITYTARDPDESAAVANAVADSYLQEQIRLENQPAVDRAKRYTEELEQLKEKVQHAEEAIADFRKRSSPELVDVDLKNEPDRTLLTSLEERLAEAQSTRRAAEAHSAEIQKSGISDDALGSNTVQNLKSNIAALEAKRSELAVTLGPKHPQVVQLESQIQTAKQNLDETLRTFSDNKVLSIDTSRNLEAKLQAAIAQEQQRVSRLQLLREESVKYQLELESAQAVYKRALEGYDPILFAANNPTTNIRFTNRATRPLTPTKGKSKKLAMIGAVLGIVLGVGLPFLYELFNRRIRCRDDIERDIGMPVIAEFPSIALQAAK